MAKEFFKDLPNTTTPLNASRLNGLLDGEEALGNIVVDSIRSKNLLKLKNGTFSSNGVTAVVNDGIVTLNNTATSTSFIFVSDYVTLEAGTYTLSVNNTTTFTGDNRLRLYDDNNTVVSGANAYFSSTNGKATFTLTTKTNVRAEVRTNSGTAYSNFVIKPQLEKGSTATNYTPYQNIKDGELYSTGEIKIGYWIDGKPLYRTVYAITTPTVTTDGTYPTNASVNLNLSNIDIIYVKNAFIISSGSKYSLPYINKSGRTIGIFVDSSNYLQITCNSTSYSNKSGYAVVEYTKTTD